MNKQIWELAFNSGFDVDPTGTFGNYSEMYKIKKFAELIIQKCCAEITEEPFNAGAASAWLKDYFEIQENENDYK